MAPTTVVSARSLPDPRAHAVNATTTDIGNTK
jgi:hypothetical protein